MTKVSKIGILTSGGDSPGMNAAIRAVTRAGINNGLDVFGIMRGYEGMIDGEIKQLAKRDVSGILQKGGTVLKTSRSKRFFEPDIRRLAHENLKKNGIDALVVIGGDGSFKGASVFSQEFDIPVVGIPGTIDNDMYGTDYTIGFDTCLNTVMEAVDKIRDTASSHDRIFFVEVMGREAGFVALQSGIASGVEAILIPEVKGQIDNLVDLLAKPERKNKSSIIFVAEGHTEGNTYEIAEKVGKTFPDLDIRVTILGHIQRGGSPTAYDRITASRMGVAAVEALIDDQKSIMIGIANGEIVHVPLSKTVKLHKEVPQSMLDVAKILV
jgi:6-phosphofructokinase 1